MDIKIDKIAQHILTGRYGENVALDFLINKGFELIDRNVRYKWGELDLIVKRGNIVHFIEVKTRMVIHETDYLAIKPQDNMTFYKFKRFCRSIETFLVKLGGQEAFPWQIDLISVILLQKDNSVVFLEWEENIVL